MNFIKNSSGTTEAVSAFFTEYFFLLKLTYQDDLLLFEVAAVECPAPFASAV